jgi:hypothetical protein
LVLEVLVRAFSRNGQDLLVSGKFGILRFVGDGLGHEPLAFQPRVAHLLAPTLDLRVPLLARHEHEPPVFYGWMSPRAAQR